MSPNHETHASPSSSDLGVDAQVGPANSSDPPFFILAVDGGGFRGLFAAHILRRIEDEWHPNWREHFGLFAGTSTGAILAAGLATGVSAQELASFYEEHGRDVFRPRLRVFLGLGGLLFSRYRSASLKSALTKCLPDTSLGAVTVPLLIPAVDTSNGCVHVLKSAYDPGFTRDKSVSVVDAVLASCSAPMYFDPTLRIPPYQLADGGLWANNPSLAAFVDARCRLKKPAGSIHILSIGTGTSRTFYPQTALTRRGRLWNRIRGWGFLTRWERQRLVEFILNLQSASADNMLHLLFGETPTDSTHVLRLTFSTDRALPLDNVALADDLRAWADRCFTHRSSHIARFLRVTQDHSDK